MLYDLSNEKPEISCVIPAYESIDLLSRCLMSVLTQESVHTEVLVCDDSYSQDVLRLVEFLATRYKQLRYIRGTRSGNPVQNWNKGIDEARANYCVVIHHDEFLVDTKYLRKALDKLQTDDLSVVIGRCRVIGINRRSCFHSAQRLMLSVHAPLWTLYATNWIGPTAVFVFKKLNNLRFNSYLIYLVDVDFYYRILVKVPTIELLEDISVVSIGHHSAQITDQCDVFDQCLKEVRLISFSHGTKLSQIQRNLLVFFAWARHRLRIL